MEQSRAKSHFLRELHSQGHDEAKLHWQLTTVQNAQNSSEQEVAALRATQRSEVQELEALHREAMFDRNEAEAHVTRVTQDVKAADEARRQAEEEI